MLNTNDLWELMGELEADDVPQLTRLFTIYEERLSRSPGLKRGQIYLIPCQQTTKRQKSAEQKYALENEQSGFFK